MNAAVKSLLRMWSQHLRSVRWRCSLCQTNLIGLFVRTQSNVAEADVKAFLEPKVAEYKQLGAVHFVDEIPKSASGKILKRVLRGE